MSGRRPWRRASDTGPAHGAVRRHGRARSAVIGIAALVVVAAVVLVVVHLTGSPTAASPAASGGSAPGGGPTGGGPSGGTGPAGHRHGATASPSRSSRGRGHGKYSGPSAGHPALPQGRLVPAEGALFGAYAEPVGGDSYPAFEGAVLALERHIGRRLAIDNLYDKWTHPLPIRIARWDLNGGRIPMISWAGASTSRIVAGAYDNMIWASAYQLRALGGPVMLRWFYEMDGSTQRPMIQSPASFIAAWRHVHSIFVRAGASNVSWVWCPNALHFVGNFAQQYYPGGQYVNWVCADGYNWAGPQDNSPVKSFAKIFSTFYRWGVRTGKPLMVGEFGALERSPGAKAAWYRQTAFQLRTMFPAIRAVVYFNSDHDGFDWRITTSASALAAFRSFATDPYFSARPRI